MARSRKSKGWVAKHDDQAIPESVQRHILERQMNADGLIICPDCGNPIRPGQKKAFDHEVPLIDGGEHSEANLRAIHERPCHAIKTVQENKARTKARSQFAAVHGIKTPKAKIPNRPFGGFASNPISRQLTDAIGLLLLMVWFFLVLLYAEWLRYPSDSLVTQFIGGWF